MVLGGWLRSDVVHVGSTAVPGLPAKPVIDLMAVLSAGDPAVVFGGLFDAYAPGLHRYLARRVGEATADDLVAETFLIALCKRADYQPQRLRAHAPIEEGRQP